MDVSFVGKMTCGECQSFSARQMMETW